MRSAFCRTNKIFASKPVGRIARSFFSPLTPHAPGVCVAVLFSLFSQSGCQELSSRREIQEADQLYHQSKFDEAIALYEDALDGANLPVGHHNAALANLRAFVAGDKSDRNKQYAKRAIHHFSEYLKVHPNDMPMTLFLTRIWVDSEDYESAIAYWEGQLEKNPGKTEIMSTLAEINKQAGKPDEALGWMYKMVDAEPDKAGKVAGYASLAGIQISRLSSAEYLGAERLKIADEGIAALKKAVEMDPANKELRGYLSMIYKLRAISHGAKWAQAIDETSQAFYRGEYAKVLKAERAREAKEAGLPPPAETPAETADPTEGDSEDGAAEGEEDSPTEEKDSADGSADSADGSADSADGSADSADGSADSADGSADSEEGAN